MIYPGFEKRRALRFGKDCSAKEHLSDVERDVFSRRLCIRIDGAKAGRKSPV